VREEAVIRVTLDRPEGEDAPRTELGAVMDWLFQTWYPTARHLHPRIELDDIREAEDRE
jgi:hypothetical protein